VANLLKAEILGQEFTLKGDLEEQALEKVAAHLKGKIREIQANLPGANKVQLSVLAALNITYDYFLLKEEFERTMNTLETKGREWLRKLETGVPQSPSSEV
jgi:cell division protein ZapA